MGPYRNGRVAVPAAPVSWLLMIRGIWLSLTENAPSPAKFPGNGADGPGQRPPRVLARAARRPRR
jgi:hypothetical protein